MGLAWSRTLDGVQSMRSRFQFFISCESVRDYGYSFRSAIFGANHTPEVLKDGSSDKRRMHRSQDRRTARRNEGSLLYLSSARVRARTARATVRVLSASRVVARCHRIVEHTRYAVMGLQLDSSSGSVRMYLSDP